ncbi:MAG: DUF3575 domain-containing protein [Candidatus Cryptobacteroides sp.]
MTLKLMFRCGHYNFDSAFCDNAYRVDAFFESLDSIAQKPGISIDHIAHIRSSASPEGGKRRNDFLSLKRAESLVSLVKSRSSIVSSFEILSVGPDWDSYNTLLSKSALSSAQAQRRFYPMLRQATMTLYYYPEPVKIEKVDYLAPAPELVWHGPNALAARRMQPVTDPLRSEKPLFALKSNLLFDALGFVNLGVEVPLGQRFSVGADAVFPWWSNPRKDFTMQMLEAELSAKYWLGKRDGKEALTGLFAGIYAGAGYYDFQLGRLTDGNGVQGDVFLLAGLQAGYAHKIGQNLRLEYSAGLAYIKTEYYDYISVKDTKFGDIKVIPYPWRAKRTTGVMPTKLSVSLVWMISSKKGGRR